MDDIDIPAVAPDALLDGIVEATRPADPGMGGTDEPLLARVHALALEARRVSTAREVLLHRARARLRQYMGGHVSAEEAADYLVDLLGIGE